MTAPMRVINGSLRDGIFLAAGAIAKGEIGDLFQKPKGEQADGFTSANGFANGKPVDITSSIKGGELPNSEKFVAQAMAIHVFPADYTAEKNLETIAQIQRFIYAEFNFNNRGVENLGNVGQWPGGVGVAEGFSALAAAATTSHVSGINGAPQRSNVRRFAQPIEILGGKKFDLKLLSGRAFTLPTAVEIQIELLGHRLVR